MKTLPEIERINIKAAIAKGVDVASDPWPVGVGFTHGEYEAEKREEAVEFASNERINAAIEATS